MASLLPNGQQQFFDSTGNPLAGGTVSFYVPNTLSLKSTWQDAGQSILNSNPVVLDAGGRAMIYGSGAYRQQVRDSLGNLIWDQQTADLSASVSTWVGTSSGSANSQTVLAVAFSSSDGQTLTFRAGFTNTASATLSINGVALAIYKPSAIGPVQLSGGELIAGNVVSLVYSSAIGGFILTNPQSVPIMSILAASTALTTLQTGGIFEITASIIVTLPSPVGNAGIQYRFSLQTALAVTFLTPAGTIIPNSNPGAATLVLSSNGLNCSVFSDGTNWIAHYVPFLTPQITVYSTGSGTYTTPTGATWLEVKAWAAGGGGAGDAGTATAGGATTFGTIMVLGGGGAGTASTTGSQSLAGAGGVVTLGSPAAQAGGRGDLGREYFSPVTSGGASFGGAGGIGSNNLLGPAQAATFPGAGGGTYGTYAGGNYVGGGGGGAYDDMIITSPAASYTYAIGVGGTGATNAGAGASGKIIITAYFGA